MSIGLKTHIGKRPGIGYRGVTPLTFTMDMYVRKRNDPGQTFTCDFRVATRRDPGQTFTTDLNIMTGRYTNTFTIDIHILKGKFFTIDMYVRNRATLTFTADLRVATRKSTGTTYTTDIHIATRRTKAFTTDIEIQLQGNLKTFSTDLRVATTKDPGQTFTADLRVATRGLTGTFTSDLHIVHTGYTKTFTTDINVALYKTKDFTVDTILFKYPVYVLNGFDLTNYIKQPDMSGLTKKLNKYTAPFQILSTIVDMGTDPLQYTFEVLFMSYNMYDSFLTLVNSDIRGTDSAPIIFYPGRDDVFHKVKAMSARPTLTWQGKEYKAQVTLDLEDPYLYSVHTYEHSQATVATNPGFTTRPFVNEGSVNSPFEQIDITGRYIGGQHLTNVIIYVMDGATVDNWMPISNQLLYDEVASLNVYGYITCTYSDTYSTSTKYTADVYASSAATCSGGKVRITSGGYVTYKFSGPHPVLYNTLLSATLNAVAGSPLIYVSSDNANWVTAVRADQIVNNVLTDYYINGSEKLGDIYIKFSCPTGATLDILDVSFTTIRDATYYLVPYIPAWLTRTLLIYGLGSSVAGIDCIFRARKWP